MFSPEALALINEAKAAATGWKRVEGSQLVCKDGRCVLGAVIHARGIVKEIIVNSYVILDNDEEYEFEDTVELPSPNDAVYLLRILCSIAEEIIKANDNMDKESAEELDKLLGVVQL